MIPVTQTFRLEPMEPADGVLPTLWAIAKLIGSTIAVAAFVVLIYFLCVGGCLVFNSVEACHV